MSNNDKPHTHSMSFMRLTPENVEVAITNFDTFSTLKLILGETTLDFFFKNERDVRDFLYKACACDAEPAWSNDLELADSPV